MFPDERPGAIDTFLGRPQEALERLETVRRLSPRDTERWGEIVKASGFKPIG
jgi:hypothetical protein